MLREIGWEDESSQRRFRRYASEQINGRAPLDRVEDALERIGLRIWDVYPQIDYGEPFDRWCDVCGERVTTDETHVCPCCESATEELSCATC